MTAARLADAPTPYWLGDLSLDVCGQDGMGPIDVTASDAEIVVLGPLSRISDLKELRLAGGSGMRRLVMRRGVRDFDLLYDCSCNALLASQRFYGQHGHLLAPSLRDATAVRCAFGRTERTFVFGNLKTYSCFRSAILWSRSTFRLAHVMARYKLWAAGEESQGTRGITSAFEAEGLILGGADEYVSPPRQPPLLAYVPESLALNLDGCPAVINLAPNTTLMHDSLAASLRTEARPKSRVAGLRFYRPAVPVTFE